MVEFNAVYMDNNHPNSDCRNNFYWKLPLDTVRSEADTLITIYFPRDTIHGSQYDWVSERPIEEVCGDE